MKLLISFFAILLFTTLGITQQRDPNLTYKLFTEAYDSLDAESLANLYSANAELLNLYDGSMPNSRIGRAEIFKYYSNFFENIRSQNQKLYLSFKIQKRDTVGNKILDNGFYKLEVLTPNKPSQFGFGKFSTILQYEDNSWKFKTDATTNVDFIEYENSDQKAIPEREELLHPEYHDQFLGTYVNESNQTIVIGRSQLRLFMYNEATGEYRGMNKINATTWEAGQAVISKKGIDKIIFSKNKLEIYRNEKLLSSAQKIEKYTTEKVEYKNTKGLKLAGTIFKPIKSNGNALVLIHGSGPQDRNGYASIIRLLADVLARRGITVLTYDKQGVGQSEGNSDAQSFTHLAQDALAGNDYLRSRRDLKLTKIGLGGSSQAGWIIAKAIAASESKVDFVFTIGAAGSGNSVVEQNLYNTKSLMQCTNQFSEKQIDNALIQQSHFFNYIQNQSTANILDEYTRSISTDSLLRDWIFPSSNEINLNNKNQWFTALEIGFDPLSIWRNYKKPTLMIFGEYDNSTPSAETIAKIKGLGNRNIKIQYLKNTQHIGLKTTSICNNDLSQLSTFNNELFNSIIEWIIKV